MDNNRCCLFCVSWFIPYLIIIISFLLVILYSTVRGDFFFFFFFFNSCSPVFFSVTVRSFPDLGHWSTLEKKY